MNMLNEKIANKKSVAPRAASYKSQIHVKLGPNINVKIKARKTNLRGGENVNKYGKIIIIENIMNDNGPQEDSG